MSTIKVDAIQTRAGVSEISITTLKADTIKGSSSAGSMAVVGEGGSTTTNLQQGLSKCWARWDGSGTAANKDSFNIASVSDESAGDYIFTVTNAFSSANFSCTANGRQSESPAWTAMTSSVGATAATTVRITSRNTSNTATDQKQLHTQFMGDLA